MPSKAGLFVTVPFWTAVGVDVRHYRQNGCDLSSCNWFLWGRVEAGIPAATEILLGNHTVSLGNAGALDLFAKYAPAQAVPNRAATTTFWFSKLCSE